MIKAKTLLISAGRQYRHNYGDDNKFVIAYDKLVTEEIVADLLRRVYKLECELYNHT